MGDVFDALDVSEAKQGLSDLFGRQRAWSDEEQKLFEKLMPITKIDLWLLRWAYLLDRNEKGWAVVDDTRLNKPKHNLIALLREFPSEVDKWRASRKQLGLSPTFIKETPAGLNKEEPPGWREPFPAGIRLMGCRFRNSFWQLDIDLRAKLPSRLKKPREKNRRNGGRWWSRRNERAVDG